MFQCACFVAVPLCVLGYNLFVGPVVSVECLFPFELHWYKYALHGHKRITPQCMCMNFRFVRSIDPSQSSVRQVGVVGLALHKLQCAFWLGAGQSSFFLAIQSINFTGLSIFFFVQMYFEPWRRLIRYFVSFLVMVPMLCVAVVAMCVSLNLNNYVRDPDSPLYIGRLAVFAQPVSAVPRIL